MSLTYEIVPKHEIILEGVVGSTAYGLATPSSDIDLLGVHLWDNSVFFGLKQPKRTIVTHDPDCTYHELNKYISLLFGANPTVSELLWLNTYTKITPQGKKLLDARDMFLTQKVRKTYGGYALQQAQRLADRGNFTRRRRTEKHGRHCCRLILQGQHILEHGRIKIKLSPEEVDLCFYAGRLARDNIEAFNTLFCEMMEWFDGTSSDLPDQPDLDQATMLIFSIRGLI